METILKSNKDLADKLREVKNKLLNIHLETNNSTDLEIMGEIAKLNEVSDEVKEMLILLHTNTVTENKLTTQAMIKTHNDILDISSEIIQTQNNLILKLKDQLNASPKKPSLFNKAGKAIAESKTKLLWSLTGVTTVLVFLYVAFPEETKFVINALSAILKG